MKKKVTVQLEEKMVEELKDIIYWDPDRTLNLFIEEAVYKAIEEYKIGRKVKKRPSKNLKPGRPIE